MSGVDEGTVSDVSADVVDDSADESDDVEVLPWWRNPINVVAIAVAIALLSGAVGWVIGNNRALPDPNRTDVGFLQDMRTHHEQAVQMSFIYLALPDGDSSLRTVASTILLEQQLEIGRMIQLLRDYGENEVNDTDLVMGWMGTSIPVEQMPGLASEDDLQTLRTSQGAAADELFVRLMTAHHEGGIHMAEHAVEHAGTSEVRRIAEQVVVGQTEEIAELTALLTRSQSS